MEKGQLDEVKAILKSLVLSCPDKMTVDKLNRDYRDVEGEFIPHRRLGYGNIEEFLRSIPDTVMVYGNGPAAMVCFVANKKSDHIHDMIMQQKKPSRGARRSKVNNKSSIRNTTPSRSSNRYSHNARPRTRRKLGQQLSDVQSTNRNHMTKTLTVWNAATPSSISVKYLNHRPPCLDSAKSYTCFQLPQPSGIQLPCNIIPKDIPKIEKKSRSEDINEKALTGHLQQHKEQVNQLTSRMTSLCKISSQSEAPKPHLKTTPPLSPATQSQPPPLRTVSFISEIKTTDYTTSSKLAQSNILIGVKPPKTTNGLQALKKPKPKIKLSEDIERLLTIPTRGRINPIEEECEPNVTDENIDYDARNPSQNINKTDISKKLFDVSDEKVHDLDEAVPLFAANNIVYRLDFPEHSVGYGRKIARSILSDDVYIGACLRIFIAEIHNPFNFWFHIQKDEHELDSLMYHIERFYTKLEADELRIPLACLTPGQICAACYNDLWHRAEIVAPPVNNKIKVSFVDYGTVSEVDVSNIKFLAASFADLPAQALRGCLSHIKPRSRHWSHEATLYFLSLVSELMLYAKVTEIDRENQVVYMILCNTYGDEVLQINTELIQKVHAFYNEEWLDTRIKKNNGQRLHHPREDFPTFSMIESGEYPSFAELINLQERGIDYEAIYDQIIFNKSAILNKHENAPEAIRKLPYFLMTTNPFRSDIIKQLNGMTAKAE